MVTPDLFHIEQFLKLGILEILKNTLVTLIIFIRLKTPPLVVNSDQSLIRGVADKLGENLLLLYQCNSGVFTPVMKIYFRLCVNYGDKGGYMFAS